MKNKVLIIIGMHRSGTSLIAQWISRCGLNIGENLLPAHFTNKDGHFEDIDFYNLHEKIFSQHGITYGGFKHIENFKPTTEEKVAIQHLINIKNSRRTQWGWKDPRTCLFLKEYLEILPKATILIVLRDYNAIINSLINREIVRILIRKRKKNKCNRLFFKYIFKPYTQDKLAVYYSKALIIYYDQIISALRNHNPENIIVSQLESIPLDYVKILNRIKSRGFSITPYPIEFVYKKELINSNTCCNYIPSDLRRLIEDQVAYIKSNFVNN